MMLMLSYFPEIKSCDKPLIIQLNRAFIHQPLLDRGLVKQVEVNAIKYNVFGATHTEGPILEHRDQIVVIVCVRS